MSNRPANRPSTARKRTPADEKKRNEALAQGYRMTIDGQVYQAVIGDVTPTIARELRQATGHGFMGLLQGLGKDADIDLISEAVWVARRINGEAVTLDEVEVGYQQILSDDFEVDVAQDEEAKTPDPEA